MSHALALLRMRRERPRCCHTSKKGDELAPSHCLLPRLKRGIVTVQTRFVKGRPDVRFGSKADMCSAKGHVRFAPNSDRESGLPQTVMSASPPKSGHLRCNSSCLLWAKSRHSTQPGTC